MGESDPDGIATAKNLVCDLDSRALLKGSQAISEHKITS